MSRIDDMVGEPISMSDALVNATKLMPNSAYAFSVIEKHQEQQRIELAKISEERARQQGKRDGALFQTVEMLQESNKLLEKQNALLQEMYNTANAEAEESKKEAKSAKRISWISIAVAIISIGVSVLLHFIK